MLQKMDMAAVPGLFAGATTNTPSLTGAAGVGRAAGFPGRSRGAVIAGGCGRVSGGIAGIIGSLLILRALFRIDPGARGGRVSGGVTEGRQSRWSAQSGG